MKPSGKKMKRIKIFALLFVILLGLLFADINIIYSQTPETVTNDWKLTGAGLVKMLLINRFRMYSWGTDYPGLIDLEYPPGSGEEHVSRLLMYVGAILPDGRKVITSNSEAWPTAASWDTIWVVNKGETVDIGGTFEGQDDIYWPNYKAVSDQDFICRYNDYQAKIPNPTGEGQGHIPMNIDVIQVVYTWSSGPLKEVVLFKWFIIPVKHDLDNVYMMLSNESKIGDVSKNPEFGSPDDRTFFIEDMLLAGFEDGPGGDDGDAIGSLGLMFLVPEQHRHDDLQPSYLWSGSYFGSVWGVLDEEKYDFMMAGNKIFEDQLAYNGGASFQSIGPFDVDYGDTLNIMMAVVLGEGVDNMITNAKAVIELEKINFSIPSAPPSPPLEVNTSDGTVELSWFPTLENNPENYQDENRADNSDQPFEGYRIYKSTQSKDGPYVLLAEYDIPDNVYGENIGLEYNYIDDGLLNNFEYYYSVTTFSKEDTILNWPSMESSIFSMAVTAIPGTPPPDDVGNVAVVPNPYRGDILYRDYNPPWEKPPTGREWMEQDRRIQFINLPGRCQIKIYTITGDYIETIEHDNPARGYADWDLTSSIGQAVASGLYLFTVKNYDTDNVQVGKFVIIK